MQQKPFGHLSPYMVFGYTAGLATVWLLQRIMTTFYGTLRIWPIDVSVKFTILYTDGAGVPSQTLRVLPKQQLSLLSKKTKTTVFKQYFRL